MTHFLTPTKKNSRGFSLMEVMVAVSIFIIVAMVAGSSFVGLVSAYKTTSVSHQNMDNLNISIESMVRSIKKGTNYHCGPDPDLSAPLDCALSPSDFLTFLSSSGDPVTYSLGKSSYSQCPSPSQVCKKIGDGEYLALTDPSIVSINHLLFFVLGTSLVDSQQPRVVIVIDGTAGRGKDQTTFSLQTMVSQRNLDIP